MPWLRLWTDILDDPDIIGLPDDTKGAWMMMLAVTKRLQPGPDGDGTLPPLRRLAAMIHQDDEGRVARYVEELIAAGLIEDHDGTLRLHNWARWQEKHDRTNAKRQTAWRERHPKSPPERAAGATPRNAVTPNSIPEGDEEREREVTPRNGRVTGVTASNGVTHANSLSRSPSLDEKTTGRTGDEHRIFVQAVAELEAHKPTEFLAGSLVMAADSPGVRSLPSWRLMVACRTVQRPDKSKTWGLFQHVAETCTRADYEKLCRPLADGLPSPAGARPGTNQPAAPAADEMARITAELANRPKLSPKQLLEMHRAKQN